MNQDLNCRHNSDAMHIDNKLRSQALVYAIQVLLQPLHSTKQSALVWQMQEYCMHTWKS